MSKVKKVIETTISEVKKYATQPYGARLYSWESVIDLLQNIENEIDDEDSESPAVLTDEQIESLAEHITGRVESAIDGMSESDMIDPDSIEMSIYRGHATVEGIDVDKSNIVAAATDDIQSAIEEWIESQCR